MGNKVPTNAIPAQASLGTALDLFTTVPRKQRRLTRLESHHLIVRFSYLPATLVFALPPCALEMAGLSCSSCRMKA